MGGFLKEEKQGVMRERMWGLRGREDGFKGFDWSYPKQRAPLSCLTRRIEGWSRPPGRW